MQTIMRFGLFLSLVWIAASAVSAQHTGTHNSGGTRNSGAHAGQHGAAADSRVFVELPAPMKAHMLSNMRDHLLALEEIQTALAKGDTAEAAKVAENRLGMSSLGAHGAHDVSKFMPQGMQEAGTGMHRAASRFAVVVQDAGVTGDLKPALSALSTITSNCNGCHAGWRVQ